MPSAQARKPRLAEAGGLTLPSWWGRGRDRAEVRMQAGSAGGAGGRWGNRGEVGVQVGRASEPGLPLPFRGPSGSWPTPQRPQDWDERRRSDRCGVGLVGRISAASRGLPGAAASAGT